MKRMLAANNMRLKRSCQRPPHHLRADSRRATAQDKRCNELYPKKTDNTATITYYAAITDMPAFQHA